MRIARFLGPWGHVCFAGEPPHRVRLRSVEILKNKASPLPWVRKKVKIERVTLQEANVALAHFCQWCAVSRW